MDVYTIRNEHGSNVAITNGYIGGARPELLKIGDVWMPTCHDAYGKMLRASGRAAAKRFKCGFKKIKTTCIGQPG
jgi:hypothetical protein